MNTFFQDLALNQKDMIPGFGLGALLGFLVAFLVAALIIAILVYIYTSLAFMAIARRKKMDTPGLAWIPVIGPALIASRIAKMPWWPILLLIGIVIPFIGGVFFIAFGVFFIIWMWKTFEALNKPGWWAILPIIPLVGQIIFLIFLGIAAWGKD